MVREEQGRYACILKRERPREIERGRGEGEEEKKTRYRVQDVTAKQEQRLKL